MNCTQRTFGWPVFFSLLAVASAFGVIAQERTNSPAEPKALQDLQPDLSKIVHSFQPKSTLAFEDDTLVGQYQTQKFMVHSVYMTGEISSKAFEELGPNYQGFLLRLRVDKEPYSGQSTQPYGVWHRQYWSEYINEYRLKNKDGYLRMELSYGVRTDKDLLAKIKQTVAAYADPLYKEEQPQNPEQANKEKNP